MSFRAVFQAEVLFNSRRVAPYVMALLFAGNALLWWGWGPAAGRGWATNSDFFIAGVLPVFSFMTLPLFTALIMADPVIRDFRIGISPLIFSKPLGRAQYLLGKFLGNFFVLACCQSAFVLTLFVLQAFRRPGMIVQDARAIPYLKHFIIFVVISHLVLASLYFTVGALTRKAKIVYGLGVAFYPIYIGYQVIVLKSLPPGRRSALDPLLMNWGDKSTKGRSAELINQLAVVYDADLFANRGTMILIAAIFLSILYVRFSFAERSASREQFSTLRLSTAAEQVFPDAEHARSPGVENLTARDVARESTIEMPSVSRANDGIRAGLQKLIAMLESELRLLRAERSLVVIIPLAVFLSILEVAFYQVVPEVSYSAAYATGTAKSMLLFLIGITVFYTGEAMHRDRELKIEPLIWAAPIPNGALLFSRFMASFALTATLIGIVGATAIVIQIVRGHNPVELLPYLEIYAVILIPGIVALTAISVLMNVLLRDKYLAYAVSIGIGAGAFYLYGQGHTHWLYNPFLYQRWNYAELMSAGILLNRLYWLGIACGSLLIANWIFERKSGNRLLRRKQ
jgi:ABC-type transport system involved in multi-copper enzyme maturation permease subunit